MTQLSEITLQQFNHYHAAAQESILTILEWLEDQTGVSVIGLHFDDQNFTFTFGPPLDEDDETQQPELEAQ